MPRSQRQDLINIDFAPPLFEPQADARIEQTAMLDPESHVAPSSNGSTTG